MLKVERLCKEFGGVPVVQDLSFEVREGDVVALVGANGAGKTTTLRCIVGADYPDSGAISLDGEPYDETSPAVRRRVCALLDDWACFGDMTVREHLALFAHAHDADAGVADEALGELGIESVADRVPDGLSSGQTQRFALAQACVRPWDLLILDEPEQRLDQQGRAWLGDYLERRARRGKCVLMASHDPALQRACGARVLAVERLRL